jgi:predicted secreted Zn-dependent protease
LGDIRVNRGRRFSLLLACLASLPSAANADWQAVEKVQTYAIAGQSGPELYASIGARGPKLGLTRAIAHTSFKLTWSRKYEAEGDACVLVSARPKLAITYTLPKPTKSLSGATREHWETFIAGVHKHELVHGDFIKEMVKKIEAVTVGLTVPADPQCRKIKTEMTKRLGALSNAQRQQSRDFDRVELSDGGNIHQLILDLVNGG